jgi:hypothetical protein
MPNISDSDLVLSSKCFNVLTFLAKFSLLFSGLLDESLAAVVSTISFFPPVSRLELVGFFVTLALGFLTLLVGWIVTVFVFGIFFLPSLDLSLLELFSSSRMFVCALFIELVVEFKLLFSLFFFFFQ